MKHFCTVRTDVKDISTNILNSTSQHNNHAVICMWPKPRKMCETATYSKSRPRL